MRALDAGDHDFINGGNRARYSQSEANPRFIVLVENGALLPLGKSRRFNLFAKSQRDVLSRDRGKQPTIVEKQFFYEKGHMILAHP